MKLISVDPSSIAPAYSIWQDSELIKYGKMPLHPLSKWRRLLSQCDTLVIEGQYYGKNVHSLIVLVKSVGMLIGQLKDGIKVVEIGASTWQSAMLMRGGKREQLKELSLLRASDIVGEKITDNDISDAICMSMYHILNEGRNK